MTSLGRLDRCVPVLWNMGAKVLEVVLVLMFAMTIACATVAVGTRVWGQARQ
jgi:hypothetical protein